MKGGRGMRSLSDGILSVNRFMKDLKTVGSGREVPRGPGKEKEIWTRAGESA